MSRKLDQFAVDFGQVAKQLSLDELAAVFDLLAVELVSRMVPGISACQYCAQSLRERARAIRQARPIHGDDCGDPPP